MSLIFAIDQWDSMRQNLSYVLIVQYIYFLILGKSVVENVHYYASVIHHVQGIDGWGDVALRPPILNDFYAADSPLYHPN
jgi:hypothetical protein